MSNQTANWFWKIDGMANIAALIPTTKQISAAMETGIMGEVTSFGDSLDFSEVMTTSMVAQLLHCSCETVRQLTERSWHPLPSINIGMGKRRQRLFRRASVLRWMQEEENTDTTLEPLPVQTVAIPRRSRPKAG